MIPGFILKLWKMINDPQCDDLIAWSDNGQSFIIMDPPKFSQELSKYFKHNNLSSFIRQLNMYGFRKFATIENSGLHPGNDDLHFYHPDFVRDKPERLEAIKRKLPQKLSDSVDLRNVYKGITEIEDKQKDVTQTLQDLKRENEMLWSELHDLRQKHQQQQLYISRLMKLVFEAMEQNGIKTNMLEMKRKAPLMIEAASGSTTTEQRTVPSPTIADENSTSSNNPVIVNNDSYLLDAARLDVIAVTPTEATSASLTEADQQNLVNTQITPSYATTTWASDEDTHSLKKSRLTRPQEASTNEEYHQDHQVSGEGFGLRQDMDLNTPLNTTEYDITNHFRLMPNDELQSQINSNELHIDTLVPTIGDFTDDDLNLFSE